MATLKCVFDGKHGGAVKRRPILRENGSVPPKTYSLPKCDKHYALDLKNAVKRGKVAEQLLAKLG